MSNRDPFTAEVLVNAEVSVEDEQAIADAFGALNVAARTRLVPTRRNSEQLQWLVLATLPLHALLSGLGSAAAQDVAKGLKRLVGRAIGAQHKTVSSKQVLVLQDVATRLQVVLEADLPAEAYQRWSHSTFLRSARVRCTTTARVAGGARSWMSGSRLKRRVPDRRRS